MSPERIDAAAKAIARVMGCPKVWHEFRPEAKAALTAADKVGVR